MQFIVTSFIFSFYLESGENQSVEKGKLLDDFDLEKLYPVAPMTENSSDFQTESDSDEENESEINIMDKNLSLVSSISKALAFQRYLL